MTSSEFRRYLDTRGIFIGRSKHVECAVLIPDIESTITSCSYKIGRKDGPCKLSGSSQRGCLTGYDLEEVLAEPRLQAWTAEEGRFTPRAAGFEGSVLQRKEKKQRPHEVDKGKVEKVIDTEALLVPAEPMHDRCGEITRAVTNMTVHLVQRHQFRAPKASCYRKLLELSAVPVSRGKPFVTFHCRSVRCTSNRAACEQTSPSEKRHSTSIGADGSCRPEVRHGSQDRASTHSKCVVDANKYSCRSTLTGSA